MASSRWDASLVVHWIISPFKIFFFWMSEKGKLFNTSSEPCLAKDSWIAPPHAKQGHCDQKKGPDWTLKGFEIPCRKDRRKNFTYPYMKHAVFSPCVYYRQMRNLLKAS